MANVKPQRITARQLLSLLYTWMVDDLVSMAISRSKSREIVDNAIQEAVISHDMRTAKKETWGLKPEHIAAQQRAMQMFGGV